MPAPTIIEILSPQNKFTQVEAARDQATEEKTSIATQPTRPQEHLKYIRQNDEFNLLEITRAGLGLERGLAGVNGRAVALEERQKVLEDSSCSMNSSISLPEAQIRAFKFTRDVTLDEMLSPTRRISPPTLSPEDFLPIRLRTSKTTEHSTACSRKRRRASSLTDAQDEPSRFKFRVRSVSCDKNQNAYSPQAPQLPLPPSSKGARHHSRSRSADFIRFLPFSEQKVDYTVIANPLETQPYMDMSFPELQNPWSTAPATNRPIYMQIAPNSLTFVEDNGLNGYHSFPADIVESLRSDARKATGLNLDDSHDTVNSDTKWFDDMLAESDDSD